MTEKIEIENSTFKKRTWFIAFFITCISAFALFWAVFGILSYFYPSNVSYSLTTKKDSKEELTMYGKDGSFFISLPVQQIQLVEAVLPFHTLEIQIAFAVKQSSDKMEILSKLPLIQDTLISNLRMVSFEQLQENGRLFYLKESLLEQMNNLLYPVQIQDILFQKIVVREGM